MWAGLTTAGIAYLATLSDGERLYRDYGELDFTTEAARAASIIATEERMNSLVERAQFPNNATLGRASLGDLAEVREEQPRGYERIVPSSLGDDERQARLTNDAHLTGQLEHVRVGRDRAKTWRERVDEFRTFCRQNLVAQAA